MFFLANGVGKIVYLYAKKKDFDTQHQIQIVTQNGS